MGIRIRFRGIVGVALTGSLVSGCGGGADTDPSVRSVPPRTKMLSETQARAVLTRYTEVNNQANRQVSDALLHSSETGPVLEIDLASNRRIRAKAEKKIGPFSYRNPQFFIPRGVSSPAWFIVLAQQSAAKDWSEFLVFVDVGGAYKATAATWVRRGQRLPTIARNADGSATAVTVGPALDVGTKSAAYLTAVAAGERAPSGINPGPQLSKDGKDVAKNVTNANRGHLWQGGVVWTAWRQPVYALRTTDGGALVMNVATELESYTAIRSGIVLEATRGYSGLGRRRYHHVFTGTSLWQFTIYVPSRGPADVLAEDGETIGVAGN